MGLDGRVGASDVPVMCTVTVGNSNMAVAIADMPSRVVVPEQIASNTLGSSVRLISCPYHRYTSHRSSEQPQCKIQNLYTH